MAFKNLEFPPLQLPQMPYSRKHIVTIAAMKAAKVELKTFRTCSG